MLREKLILNGLNWLPVCLSVCMFVSMFVTMFVTIYVCLFVSVCYAREVCRDNQQSFWDAKVSNVTIQRLDNGLT